MQERAVVPSPALLAGEDEGEGTEQLGRGGGNGSEPASAPNSAPLRKSKPSPQSSPAGDAGERSPTSQWVGRCLAVRSPRPLPNQPLEATPGSCGALGSRRWFHPPRLSGNAFGVSETVMAATPFHDVAEKFVALFDPPAEAVASQDPRPRRRLRQKLPGPLPRPL